MQQRSHALIGVCIGVILAVTACAGSQQPQVTLGQAKGEVTLEMKASDFKFEPNNIKAYKGDSIVFRIENISGSGHNFTITDPKGNTLQSVSLPSKETTTVKVPLPEAGTYGFYCDKPMHSGFGMKGSIEAAP